MALLQRGETAASRPTLGVAISLAVLGLASLSGGLTAAVTVAGRAMPASATLIWIATLLGGSLLLSAWGVLYARTLRRRVPLPWSRALYLAALCHLPLLAGLGLIQAVYSDNVANFVYSVSVYGRVAYRPLVLVGLVAVPALLQLAVVAAYRRHRVAAYLPVAAPVAVAVVLRFWSLDWQLPFLFHNDERTYLSYAMTAWAHGDPNPHRFYNPSLVFYLDTALFNLIGGAPFESFRVFAAAFGQQVSDPKGMYLVTLAARGLTALFGAGTVPLVYLAGRELFGRRAGLFAGWFLALSFLHVRNSHYGTNDVGAVFFATASFLFAAKIYRTGRWRDYLWAGALGGLGTTTKYSAGIFILPILVACLARARKQGLRSLLAPAGLAPLVASYALSGLTFVLGTPYSLLDWPAFSSGFLRQASFGAGTWWGQEALPTWWMHLATLFQGFGVIPLLLAILGILVLLRPAPWPLALVAAFPAGYYAFMSGQQLYFARFTIPMLPFLAILAGCGVAWIAQGAASRRFGPLLVAVLAVVALAQPALYSIRSDLVMGREDTRVLADEWITTNLPKGGILLIDDYADLRKSQGWPSRPDLQVDWFRPTADPTPWEQQSGRPVYVVLSSFGYEGMQRSPLAAQAEEAYKPIEQQGRLVAFFGEGRDQQRVPYSQDDTYTPFWYVMGRERMGPAISIYRFD